MSIGLFDNVGKSLGFACENTFKKILRWIGLAIVMCIPIVNWITTGIFLKIYRGEEPSFENAGKSFIQGLLLWIIQLIYMIIPFIVMMLTVGISGFAAFVSSNAAVGVSPNVAAAGGVLIGLLVTLVIAILFSLIMAPAEVNFARKQSFGAAFKFGELFGMIGKLGWIKYILAWIVLIIVTFIYGLVLGVLTVIPIIGWIIALLSMPFFMMFYTKYFSNLFE